MNFEQGSTELSDEASTASMDQAAPAQTSGDAAPASQRASPDVKLEVRTVPISADQIKALESLERALRSLGDDFLREIGEPDGKTMAGGLYRLWSTLDAIRALWHAGDGSAGARASDDADGPVGGAAGHREPQAPAGARGGSAGALWTS